MEFKQKHCMVDLETLALGDDAVIVSIGACIFTEDGVSSEYYAVCDITTQPDRAIDPSTVRWWMAQEDAARAVFDDAAREHIGAQLNEFFNWCDAQGAELYWGNDPAFDLGKLEHAAKKIGRLVPWAWYNKRDFRTIRMVLPEAEPRNGVYHNALDDARYQALETIRALYGVKHA